MRAIMVMYDSLRRDMVPGYCEPVVEMPNFKRLSEHCAIFDNSFVCSLPCMPARRELHTGRPNFLHRSWGPVEPFDDSMPELLHKAGIHTHLSTDHYHYLEDGGATYSGRFSSWQCNRGQETDAWVGEMGQSKTEYASIMLNHQNQPNPLRTRRIGGSWQNVANRSRYQTEELYPQTLTFDDGIDFLDRNAKYDNWFLQIETFDPHEPFDSPKEYQDKWFDGDALGLPDWPPYAEVTEDAATIENMKKKYYSLVEFCDKSLGRVLDKMDELNLWSDTMLIVNTDHGFLLGEHDWWGKFRSPDYLDITHTPLFIWDPRCAVRDEHRDALVQTIDLAPTLLEFFNQPIPKDMIGKPLTGTIQRDEPVREYGIFGFHGGPISITDGKYLYMRAVRTTKEPVEEYTLMPTHMKNRFSIEEMRTTQLVPAFGFTKECQVMKILSKTISPDKIEKDLLFDISDDTEKIISDQNVENRMIAALLEQMQLNEAPVALFHRFGLAEQN